MKLVFSRAFSLIELLVTVAIIGIVSSITLVSMSEGKNIKEVEGAAFVASGKIREAQTSALTGKQHTPNTIPCAYRMIWGSTNITSSYVSKDGSGNCSVLTTISSATLPSGVTFTNSGAVDFVLPHGRTALAQSLVLQKGTAIQSICIQTNGQIEIKQGATSC